MSRLEAIEREARQVFADLIAGRRARFTASDQMFRRDVLTRLQQLLAGDEIRPFGDVNDD